MRPGEGRAEYHDPALGGTLTLGRGWPCQETAANRYLFLWNRGSGTLRFHVDASPVQLPRHGILCLTPGEVVSCESGPEEVVVLGFDRPFYCVETHDDEVSCNGLLFNGALGASVITLPAQEAGTLERLLAVLEEEFRIADTAQAEMLRLLLKRFIIKCTRVARRQLVDPRVRELDGGLVRQYSALVEKHFRTHRRVSDYAAMLYRSPKTLANAFRNTGSRTPQEILLDRVALEARRLLHYTDMPVNQVAQDLGFDDAAYFSRFFRNRTGVSPGEFRRGASAERPLPHLGPFRQDRGKPLHSRLGGDPAIVQSSEVDD